MLYSPYHAHIVSRKEQHNNMAVIKQEEPQKEGLLLPEKSAVLLPKLRWFQIVAISIFWFALNFHSLVQYGRARLLRLFWFQGRLSHSLLIRSSEC